MAQLSYGLGSSDSPFNHQRPANPNRSKFDLSRVTNFTCDSGMIIPFDCIPTLPGDSFDLSAVVGLETQPAVTNVLTPFRVRTHWYYLKNSDLWHGWHTLITKGRNGSINLRLPRVNPYQRIVDSSDSDYIYSFDSPHSLSSFLGCLPYHTYSVNGSINPIDPCDFSPYWYCDPDNISHESDVLTGFNRYSRGFNALPFMAYQNIVKYNYVNQNLLQDNHALFPEQGDYDWVLPYHIDTYDSLNFVNCVDGSYISDIYNSANDDLFFSPNGVYRSVDTKVSLLSLRYAPFDDDYFTSSLPWLQRGDVQTLDFTLEDFSIDGFAKLYDNTPTSGLVKGSMTDKVWSLTSLPVPSSSYSDDVNFGINGSDLSTSGSFSSSITANQLRQLIAMSVWQERNAQVNGSYNSMIWIHWQHDPKSTEHKPVFIGGTSSDISFNEVLQTSQSSSDSPLGSVSSRGTSFDDSRVGSFTCDDYGYIMGIMIITPLTTYNTSTEHFLVSEDVMNDFPFPEFENLSPQAITKKELFITGNDTKDESLFGYQDRYSYLKSRVNVNRGLFRLPMRDDDTVSDNLFSCATQSRNFTSQPSLSYQFVTQSPNNVRRDWLAYPSEPMFKVQVASRVSAVRNLSYMSTPNTFGF